MAIAFARISYHSRSQGHSAVAGAAYRAGVLLIDERTGEHHDFKNRLDVLYSEILLPEGAAICFKDREILWNAVEASETRKNSQVAKDIVLALPRDLDFSLQIDLARNFAQTNFVRHGIVADVAIHSHSDGNPHAHIYVTTRRLLGDRFDKVKARDLEPDVVRGRVVDPQFWGKQWRDFQNHYFVEQGIDLIVDANYIFLQRHEGRIRDGRSHYLKVENQLRREASVEVAVNDPNSLLNILGTKHGVFSERDIALLINKNTKTREEYEIALLGLKSHPDLILLGPGDDGRIRYTTRANYQREADMASHAHVLNGRKNHVISADLVQQVSHDFGLNSEQSDALIYITSSGDISAVVGRAGTGKSYMMRAARHVWEAFGYRVYGVAVSGIAAKGLEASSGISSSTIYSLKTQLVFGKLEIGPNDILVMDEAGMTDLHDFAMVVDAVRTSGAKLVIVGDHAQLQPVGPGAPFRAIVEQIGFVELNQIQRQDSVGDRVASRLFSRGLVGQALDHYGSQQQIHFISPEQEESEEGESGETGSVATQLRLIADWSENLTAENIDSRLILAHRNADVKELNHAARQKMQAQRLLGKDFHKVDTTSGQIMLSSGERILFLRNNRQLGISNGEFATVININNDRITVKLEKRQDHEMTFSTKEYRDFNYGYAATVHKCQGATYDHIFVYVAGRAWDRFLSYVAMTRHRKTLNIYAAQSQFKDLATLKATLSRSVLKDSVLDWPLSFSIRRGFDPESVVGWFIDKVLGIKQAIHNTWTFVINYAVFKSEKRYRKSLHSKIEQRKLAMKVALFVDLRNKLIAQARLMHQDLRPNEKLYQHHDYLVWYEQTLLKNQLAFEIKQKYRLFEKALELNNVSYKELGSLALKHEYMLHVKDYLQQDQEHAYNLRCRLADKINTDITKHFSIIKYFSEKKGLCTQTVIDKIKKDAKSDRAHRFIDEWERLKKIKSPAIERLLTAKSRVDQATTPQNITIQTRGFETAVKNLYRQEKLFSELKTIAPGLAQTFEKINKPVKAINIDWKSDKFNIEFDGLRKSSDAKLQYLVKFHDLLRNAKNKSQEKRLIQRLETLTMDIFKSKFSQVELKKLVPSLALKLEAFIQFKSQQKKIGRDL